MVYWAALTCALLLTTTSLVESADQEVTYVQPQQFIKCPPPDQLCEIQLTVSSMQTLTAYSVTNGSRGDDGYQVTVNGQGGFDFVYPEEVQQANISELFQPIVADGSTRRNLLVVNDQLPGPTIIGYKNQRVRINVTNNLGKEAITLHWHGQHVNGSSGSQNQFSDGVPFITQCPIQPSNSFLYDFRFYPAGTYWYHSHQYDERSNGMYGGLVVLEDPAQSNTDYEDLPEQHTIAFFEWFPVNSDSWIEAPYSLPDPVNTSTTYSAVPTNDGTEAAFPPFFAGFMNFGGWRYNAAASDCTRVANNSLPFFNVSQGTSYRFRLVGSQVNYAYRFSIRGHRLRIVATDGFDATTPRAITDVVDFIIVHVGERYDFILEASQPLDNYLILVETLEVPSVLAERGYCIKAHRGYSVLHYDGASDVLPSDFDESYDPLTRCTSGNPCFALNCPFENYPSTLNIQCISVVELQLSSPEPVPDDDVNDSAFLNYGFSRGPSVNDRVFQFPPSPPLSQLEDIPENNFCQFTSLQRTIGSTISPPNSSTELPTSSTITPQPPFTCIHTYTVDTNTVEMVYTNLGPDLVGGAAHPIHLHGHHYYVMDIGYPTYQLDGTVGNATSAIDCSADGGICNVGARWAPGYPRPSACEMNDTCPLKDTITVPVGGYVRIRFPRNNWGWWIMHCHIEPHLLGGMAMVVNETSVPGDFPVPNGFQKCGNYGSQDTDFPTETTTESSPTTASTEGFILLSEAKAFRNATIALAVISGLLLAALLGVVIALIIVCSKKSSKCSKPSKVEIEMK